MHLLRFFFIKGFVYAKNHKNEKKFLEIFNQDKKFIYRDSINNNLFMIK